MKKSLGAFVLVMIISCSTIKNNNTIHTKNSNPVVAHRGAFKKGQLPENSIASLREAIRLQCAGSEFDVRMTMDDSLVINHDPKYQNLNIETTNYKDLVAVPLSNGETMPTLRQYLQAGLANNKGTRLILEIKPSTTSNEHGQKIAEKVYQLVMAMGAAPVVDYISFNYDMLKKLRSLDAKVSLQYLNGDRTPEDLKRDGITGADYHISIFKKNTDWIQSAQKMGLLLNAWTVNTAEDMHWLLSQKFNYITTDEPELLLSIWNARATK